MNNKVKFYSNALEKDIEATILEDRKYTYKVQLNNSKIIVLKKKRVKEWL